MLSAREAKAEPKRDDMPDVNDLVAEYHVRQIHAAIDVQKLEEEWFLYSETGFEQKARELKARLLFAKAAQRLGNPIVIKRPAFGREHNHVYPLPKLWLANIGDRNLGYPSDSIYLWEVEPSVFKGNVPAKILKATLIAKTLGFKPYVWFVSPQSEIGEYLRASLQRDPAIVAYPIVGKENGEDVVNYEFGIVLGIWGKDIERINEVFDTGDVSAEDSGQRATYVSDKPDLSQNRTDDVA